MLLPTSAPEAKASKVIVKEVFKGVSSAEELSENVVSLGKSEATSASGPSAPEALEEGRSSTEATCTPATRGTLKTLLAIRVIDLTLLAIGENGVRLADLLENFSCLLLVVRIFILRNKATQKISQSVRAC